MVHGRGVWCSESQLRPEKRDLQVLRGLTAGDRKGGGGGESNRPTLRSVAGRNERCNSIERGQQNCP